MKKRNVLLAASGIALAMGVSSCVSDPNGDNLYTFTAETIDSYIKKDSTLSSFNEILTRVGLDRTLAAYGQYTCFAPTNDAIDKYIDSLWNDSAAIIPRNGMSANSVAGLSDSLCNEISKYHLLNGLYTIIDLSEGSTINTMLNRSISTAEENGKTMINSASEIIEYDNQAVNGYMHKIDAVIPRSTRTFLDTFKLLGGYDLFAEALEATGLADSINATDKGIKYSMVSHSDTGGEPLYYPQTCRLGFTIFAESDEVLKTVAHAETIDQLHEYANKQYKDCANWYDYVAEKGIEISTDTDYKNPWNTLNMFVRYHILRAAMAQDQLVFENTQPYYNLVNDGDAYDYYETMLPNTLVKIWEPGSARGQKTIYINRGVANNTLTDHLPIDENFILASDPYGSDGMHQVMQQGVRFDRTLNKATNNGYIHAIRSTLVYNENVKKYVLNERMRFDTTTFLHEFINNGIRYNNMTQVSALNGGGSGARVAFPINFFDNVRVYNGDETTLRYNVKGAYNAWQADTFQGWGNYDLAIKMPHVPTGDYEFRVFYTPMAHGGMMQFYMGTSSNPQEMLPMDIPLDVRITRDDPRIGWVDFTEEEDLGVATDEAMHNRGYMRGGFGYRCHPERDLADPTRSQNSRGMNAGNVVIRRVLGRQRYYQSNDYWFRIKNVISDETDLKWQLDFIEFVPVGVVDNTQYKEDWY